MYNMALQKAIRGLFILPIKAHSYLLQYISDAIPKIQLYQLITRFVNVLSKSPNVITSVAIDLLLTVFVILFIIVIIINMVCTSIGYM